MFGVPQQKRDREVAIGSAGFMYDDFMYDDERLYFLLLIQHPMAWLSFNGSYFCFAFSLSVRLDCDCYQREYVIL